LGALRQQANRDKLTGLLNRRSLEESLPELLARCRAATAPLTVMMGDVDHFKPLNDTLGHAAGDDLLRALGQLLRSALRPTDLAFRYGGDEFALILPNTTPDEARAVADRLVRLVDGLTRPLPVAEPPRLSIGVLGLHDAPPDAAAAELLDAADRLLYAIKAERKGKHPLRSSAA
jgi:diguanylate cyclase (GGDEF)-like protein